VFIQAGASNRGRDFAAKWAEVIFVTHGSVEAAQDFYRDIKGRAEKFGRDPSELKVLLGFVPSVGETRTIADERRELIDSLCEPEAGLSTMSYQIGIDLEPYPKDELLPQVESNAVDGHYKEVAEVTRKQGLTLSQLGKRYGVGPLRDFHGTGGDVADQMQRWFEAEACDGFMVQMPYAPGGVEDFARLVVPELQKRELFRTEYSGPTLRDHLQLRRPTNL
jgi:alkanesulfonate monooxygenase SsuD/methylene tetrahydromethanopterin reductase-like flavin-dependent oxidoreductase (luciferase family)